MTTLPVTLVTSRSASADDLTAADYRDIYDEIRAKCSLDRFIALVGSDVSKAWWSKYERGEAELTHDRRNELRTAVGLPTLPEPPARILAGVHPDAAVWAIGQRQADRVIMLGADAHEPLTLRVNGALQILAQTMPQTVDVTEVTQPTSAATPTPHARHRPRYFRPCLALEPAARIPQLEALLAAAQREIATP